MRFGEARLILRLEIVYSYATASEEAIQNDCQYHFYGFHLNGGLIYKTFQMNFG